MEQVVTVYTTVETEDEALRLARSLVGEGLAACANILPRGRSVYRWAGDIVDSPESFMLLKTARGKLAALKSRLVELHSYDIPCLGVWDWADGHDAYMDWILQELSDPADGNSG